MGLSHIESKCRHGEVYTRESVSEDDNEAVEIARLRTKHSQSDLNLFCMKGCLGVCWLKKWRENEIGALARTVTIGNLVSIFKGQMQN